MSVVHTYFYIDVRLNDKYLRIYKFFTAQGHCWISKLASIITEDVMREDMKGSARRYSILSWLGVHAF